LSITPHPSQKTYKQVVKKLTADFYRLTNAFKYIQAINLFEREISRVPGLEGDENILCRLGMLYDHAALQDVKRKKTYEHKALSLYKRALKINPSSVKATWGIGRIYWHNEDKKAIPYAKRAYLLAKRYEKRTGIYIQNVGLVYQTLGKFKEAELWLKKGANAEPKNWAMYLNLVVFFRYTKQFIKSKKYSLVLKKLFSQESTLFKKTPWGKKIAEVIKDAEKELNKIKK
jgi:tetratricopeptide (TPR) repeat protein